MEDKGINLMTVPRRNTPGHEYESGHEGGHSKPFETEIGYNIIDNHNKRTGRPPICTEHPPAADTMKTAYYGGDEAYRGINTAGIPKAMASGNATMPTTIPATRSVLNFSNE